MMRSMFSGVSGLRTHQTMLDVISSNISNVNTFGYKSSRATFKDVLYQTISGASAPTANLGGVNGKQVGLGLTLNSIDSMMTQGNAQSTGQVTDLMIQGDGFFRVAEATQFTGLALNAGAGEAYTRAGNFSFDSQGYLTTPTGQYVIGTNATIAAEGRLQVNPATTQSLSIDSSGVVTAIDNTGTATTVGTIRLAKFANAAGLERVAGTMWRESNNSGAPVTGDPGTTGLGTVSPGNLEMSNVDLATEFTNMIIAERGFQANGRIITTSDQMLEQLVNLRR